MRYLCANSGSEHEFLKCRITLVRAARGTAAAADVRDYYKKLFDGDGGGLILDDSVRIPHEAKPENVLAEYEMPKECVY